ncbi:MAG: polysaccharide biosynthesis/export family protein [Planctomycetia bacterium]|nr:polysaccharide biosynthesis/export family protein [Planctomycetia bacterium]
MTPHLPLSESAVQMLAEAMLHFLWQGTALWLAAVCVVHVWPIRTSQARYAFYCGLLMLLAAAPLVTLLAVSVEPVATGAALLVAPNRAGNDAVIEAAADAAAQSSDRPSAILLADSPFDMVKSWLRQQRPLIVYFWLAGAALMAARLILGGIGVWTIVRRRQPIPPETSQIVDRLARQLAFRVRPAVHAVERISQAIAVGILKPMVLLPAAWICELPSDVLEAVIAHELAHLRRWDVAINFIQRVVEAVLFFHPVVWWCSRRLRIEREMCCDELAQAAIGDRVVYAKALAYLAHQQCSSFEPLLAAGIGGGKMVLLKRIRNILGVVSGRHGRFYGPSCTLVGAVVASLVWVAIFGVPSRLRHVPPAEPFDEVTLNQGPASSSAAPLGRNVPSEKAKATLPNYTIEPPDILLIDVLKVVPKPPYRIEPADVLSIEVEGTSDFAPIRDRFIVDAGGQVDLGARYHKVHVAGLTIDEAAEAIRKFLLEIVRQPEVSVTLFQSTGPQPVSGEHLVSPDGAINLGVYGQVNVARMTLEEARAAIEKKLAEFLDNPRVAVTVFAYNSKVYYLIIESLASGDHVVRLPITGSETVLDALAYVNGLTRLSSKKIWIARPVTGTNGDTILPVNWIEITKGAATGMNYQVFPGDRIFVTERSPSQAKR